MKEKWQLAIFAAAVSLAASAATFRVAAPDGSAVCTVTPPDYGAGAVLETTNLTGCVAWRVRFTGTGDYTPCWNQARVKNTLAHQLALPCVYTSGWQFLFWYSRPDQIDDKDPALGFWREIPCAFDETRFLQGKIGEYAVVARRMKSGDVFSVDAAARGGFALIVEKAKTGQ